jgi:hypothetical protein
MKLRGDHCQCAGCGEYFARTSTFDAHRIGVFPNRRCRSAAEMTLKGWSKDGQGFWRGVKRPFSLMRTHELAAIDSDSNQGGSP